ncbi:MAG: hypothetical protein V1904_00920, partial [Bacteroidota bacterium]
MKKYFTIFILFSLFLSCFHKSVENDEADDIVKAIIYHGKDGAYLVTVESIFQASSKSSENGISYTTGYTDLRITSYDMTTGKQSARVASGDQTEENNTMLGWNEGNIWFYSMEDGLHSRDPKTLDIKITQDKILGKNPMLGKAMAECEWYKITQYFAFEYATEKLIITDNQGFHYSLDPVSFNTEKLKNDY